MSNVIELLRKKVYVWLLKWYGFDKVLKQNGIEDLEAYYDQLVKLMAMRRKGQKKDMQQILHDAHQTTTHP